MYISQKGTVGQKLGNNTCFLTKMLVPFAKIYRKTIDIIRFIELLFFIQIIRDAVGAPDVLTRLESTPASSPSGEQIITEYES